MFESETLLLTVPPETCEPGNVSETGFCFPLHGLCVDKFQKKRSKPERIGERGPIEDPRQKRRKRDEGLL